jgi:hypothetical protein
MKPMFLPNAIIVTESVTTLAVALSAAVALAQYLDNKKTLVPRGRGITPRRQLATARH